MSSHRQLTKLSILRRIIMETSIRRMLSKSIWAQALTEEQLARVEAEVVSRKIPPGLRLPQGRSGRALDRCA
jgi:hypothetical protein